MEIAIKKPKFNKYTSFKYSGIEWIGEIPKDWIVARNRALFAERKEPGNESLPLLSVSIHTAVSNEELSEEENIQGRNRIADKSNYKLVQPNDIVFNMMRAWQGAIGAVTIQGMVSPAYIVAKPNNKIHSGFFEYQYRTVGFIQQIDKNSKGITDFRKRLYWQEFKNLITILPSIEEQIAIASFLDRKTTQIDKAISIKEKQIELLKERRQILIHHAVTRGLNPNVKMKDSGVEWIREIPEHWNTITRMKYISSLKGRQGWQGLKAEEYKDEGPYVLSSAHFNNYIIEWDKCPRVSLERYLMDIHIQLNVGDLLLMKDGANMGKLALVENLPGLACLNSHLLLFRSLSKNGVSYYHPKYMFYHMMCREFQDYVKIKGTGTTFLGISQESIGNYPICLPKYEEQRVIVKFLDIQSLKYEHSISFKEKEIEKLKEYKATLINSAATGKIKVV